VPSFVLALRRFWWLVVIGALAGAAAGYFIAKRENPTYQASATILITSSEGPYFRTSIARADEVPANPTAGDTTLLRVSEPDTRTLVAAANLYPLLIESDAVSQVRKEMFGPLRGEVTARAIGSTVTVNRFEPGEIPVVEISSTAARPRDAVELTRATTTAFVSWIQREQDTAGIAADSRILIQQLTVPERATAADGGSLALPVLGGAAIFIASIGLVILLDRIVPRRRATWRAAVPPEPSVEKLKAS
jgi:capsular polysaccharide biosynthesis protein